MKLFGRYSIVFAICVIGLVGYGFTSQTNSDLGELTVSVKGFKNANGQMGICLFQKGDGFPGHYENGLKADFTKITAGSNGVGATATYIFHKLAFGTYAITVFHDENNDKVLNTNFIGIPKEGVGISNNPKSRFGPPSFNDSKFNFSKHDQKIEIVLNYL